MRTSLSILVSSAVVVFGLVACAGAPPEVHGDGAPSSSAAPSESAPPAPPVETASAAAPPSSASASAVAPVASAAPKVEPPAALPEGLKILVIGDSFAEALGVGLKAKEGEYHIKATLRGEKATFIPEWAGPNRGVPLILKQVQPSIVLIALGGNELAMTDPSVRAPKVRELVGHMGTTPCVWISPPLWGNKDNGLLEIIRKNSSPCRYFDSNTLSQNLPRGSDKIHPSAEGQKIWAGQVLEWLKKERDPKASAFALAPRPESE
jgi:lysophospholipase L1-like esterase